MKDLIVKYFIANGRVDIPNIGTLVLKTIPSSITLHQIIPPSHAILFSSDTKDIDTEQLNFLSIELDISLDETKNELIKLSHEIRENKHYQFDGIGTFKLNDNQIIFESHFLDNNYQLPIELVNDTVDVTEKVSILKKYDWIIASIILTMIALLAIYLK